MAETIRDITLRLSIEQTPTQITAPDVSAHIKTAKNVETANKSVAKSTEEAAKSATKALANLEKQAEESAAKASAASSAMVDANLRVGESFKAAGDGAFTFARGVALSFTDSDEQMAVVVERIAQVQGAFDLFKGATETVKGVTESIRAFRAAQTAASAASAAATAQNAAVATSQVAVGTTAVTATVGVTAFKVALGPIAIIVAALTAAAVLAKSAFSWLDDAGDDAARATAEHDKFLNSIERGSKLISTRVRGTLEFTRLQNDALEKRNTLDAADAQLKRELLETEQALRAGGWSGGVGDGAIQREQRRVALEGQRAQIIRDRATIQAEINNQQKAADAEHLTAAQQIRRERETELAAQQSGLKTAQQALKVSQDKLKTAQQSIGALNDAEFAEFKQLVELSKKGKLDTAGEERLAQLGGASGQAIVGASQQQRGAGRDTSFLQGTEGDFSDDVATAQTAVNDAQTAVDSATEALNVVTTEITEFQARTKSLYEQQANVLRDLTSVAIGHERTLADLQTQLANRVDAAGDT